MSVSELNTTLDTVITVGIIFILINLIFIAIALIYHFKYRKK